MSSPADRTYGWRSWVTMVALVIAAVFWAIGAHGQPVADRTATRQLANVTQNLTSEAQAQWLQRSDPDALARWAVTATRTTGGQPGNEPLYTNIVQLLDWRTTEHGAGAVDLKIYSVQGDLREGPPKQSIGGPKVAQNCVHIEVTTTSADAVTVPCRGRRPVTSP